MRTLVRKLDLHLYKETCTWLRGIRSHQAFAHDGHVILTIVAHPRVRQLKLFGKLLFPSGKSRFELNSNTRSVASTPGRLTNRAMLVRTKTVRKIVSRFLLLHLNTKTKTKMVKSDTKMNANLRNIENFENEPIRTKLCRTQLDTKI
jgi:hypothetical protein